MAGVVWPSPVLFDRFTSGDLPNVITSNGTNAFWTPSGALAMSLLAGDPDDSSNPSVGGSNYGGELWRTFGNDWFGKIILLPTSLNLGNVLSTQLHKLEIFNSFGISKNLTSFTNNSDSGISITDLPGLPAAIGTFNSIILTMKVVTTGPPSIVGTLDFGTTEYTLVLTLSGSRLVLFPYRPEQPLQEILESLTDILRSQDDSEQRVRARQTPRQSYSMTVFEEDVEASDLRVHMFDYQARLWGVPNWHEERSLGADVSAGLDTVVVDTTYSEFKVGGLAVMHRGARDFEVLEVKSLTASSLVFTSVLEKSYLAKDTSVIPVKLGYIRGNPGSQRFILGEEKLRVVFDIVDVDDSGDLTPWAMYDGRVILDYNAVSGETLREEWRRRAPRLDNQVGRILQFQLADRSRFSTSKGFVFQNSQELWELRQLFHGLHGSQVAFWLPTFRRDLFLSTDIGAGSSTIDVDNIGYTDFVFQRAPLTNVRLIKTDGTAITRKITNSTVISSAVERLTVDSAFSGSAIPASDVERIEFLMLCRVADDRMEIEHERPGEGTARVGILAVKA